MITPGKFQMIGDSFVSEFKDGQSSCYRNIKKYNHPLDLLGTKGISVTKLKSNMKGAIMTMSDRLLTRKRAIIETINYELKNIAQVEHSRHRSFDNFIVNIPGALAAYCFFPKKPYIACERALDNQITLF